MQQGPESLYSVRCFYQLSAIPLLLTIIDADALRSAPGAALLQNRF